MITTYKFATFQELIDRVPTDRIRDCLEELAQSFVQAKATVEAGIELAKAAGKDIPAYDGSGITLPLEFEWVDDGHEVVSTTLSNAKTGEEVVTIQTRPKTMNALQAFLAGTGMDEAAAMDLLWRHGVIDNQADTAGKVPDSGCESAVVFLRTHALKPSPEQATLL